MKNKIVIFDLCGTLYLSNTTFDFILFFNKSRRDRLRYLYCKLLISKIGKAASLIFKFSIRKQMLLTLKGVSRTLMNEMAVAYVKQILCFKPNMQAFDLLEKYRKLGYDVVLVSASIDPVVNVVAKNLNLDCKSSTLKYISDIFDGEIANDLKGKKHHLFSEQSIKATITDNFDDLPLCLMSDEYTIFTQKKHYPLWLKIFKKNKIKDEKNIRII